jgi:hypothetical protein
MTPSFRPSTECNLAISKALHTLDLLGKAYRQDIYRGDSDFALKLRHDLAVKLAFNNISYIALALLNKAGTVLCQQSVHFTNRQIIAPTGAGRGQEIPLIPPGEVTSHELTVKNPNRDESVYSHHLYFNWTPITERLKAEGTEWKASGHGRITGGRQAAVLHLYNQARQRLVLTRPIGARGYGFASAPDLSLEGIFLPKAEFLDGGNTHLKYGTNLAAFLVQSPAGIQARQIETLH